MMYRPPPANEDVEQLELSYIVGVCNMVQSPLEKGLAVSNKKHPYILWLSNSNPRHLLKRKHMSTKRFVYNYS